MARIIPEQLETDINSECICEYDTVEKALDASMALYAADFDANAIRIIGKDVSTIDVIRGKLTPFSAFLSGIGSGMFMMMLLTLFMVILSEKLFLLVTSSALGLFGLAAFIVAGALFVGLTRALTLFWTSKMTGRPSWRLRTIRQISPGYYELHVTKDASIARSILTTKGVLGRTTHPQTNYSFTPPVSDTTIQQHTTDADTKDKEDSRINSREDNKAGQAPSFPSITPTENSMKPTDFGSRPDEKPRYGVRLPRNEKGEIVYPPQTRSTDEAHTSQP